MEKIKKSFRVLSEKIQDSNKRIKIKFDNFEQKINPSFAKNLSKIFKSITLVSIIIVLPVIAITFGSIVSVNNQPPEVTIPVVDISTHEIVIPTVVTWFVLTTFFALLWFFFSKWNVVVKDGK